MNTYVLKMGVSRDKMFQAALILFDLLVMAALLAIPLAWLFHPLRLTLGPLHLRISWGLKPILAPLVLLAARMALARLGERQGWAPQGLMKKRGYKCLALVLISLFLFVASMEGALAAIRFKAELPPIVFVGKDSQGGGDQVPYPSGCQADVQV